MSNLYTHDQVVSIVEHGWCLYNQPHNFVYVGDQTELDSEKLAEKQINLSHISSDHMEKLKKLVSKYRCTECGKVKFR